MTRLDWAKLISYAHPFSVLGLTAGRIIISIVSERFLECLLVLYTFYIEWIETITWMLLVPTY